MCISEATASTTWCAFTSREKNGNSNETRKAHHCIGELECQLSNRNLNKSLSSVLCLCCACVVAHHDEESTAFGASNTQPATVLTVPFISQHQLVYERIVRTKVIQLYLNWASSLSTCLSKMTFPHLSFTSSCRCSKGHGLTNRPLSTDATTWLDSDLLDEFQAHFPLDYSIYRTHVWSRYTQITCAAWMPSN